MGTMIQRFGLGEEDYHAGPFAACSKDLKGNNECLNLTRPEVIKAIHKEYIAAGADIIETNTFSANEISQAEYGCEDRVYIVKPMLPWAGWALTPPFHPCCAKHSGISLLHLS